MFDVVFKDLNEMRLRQMHISSECMLSKDFLLFRIWVRCKMVIYTKHAVLVAEPTLVSVVPKGVSWRNGKKIREE